MSSPQPPAYRVQPSRRYLWTDAFAVCNYLGLYRQTTDDRYLKLARDLVNQVHHILGRYRPDDSRRGWISGLSATEGEQHPTIGGLRIGKRLNEREPDEPPDERLEWDRDGQYFHYLTKWMHALSRMARETGEACYQRWALELAATAHEAFTKQAYRGGPKRMVWKMSIDLTQPLVASMGQHDPLDGLVTFLELQCALRSVATAGPDLRAAIADMAQMCNQVRWSTEDPLGIGGLLDGATRLAQLVFEHNAGHRELLRRMLIEAEASLRAFDSSNLLSRSAENRLAFRELGLSIGIHGLPRIKCLVAHDRELADVCDRLLIHQRIAEQIEVHWCNPAPRLSCAWMEHCDINSVMLATSLAPGSYLTV